MADWTVNSGFNPLRDEEEEKRRRMPWRDPRTGEMLELEVSGTPSMEDLPRLMEEARARKAEEVSSQVDPSTAFVRGAEEKAKGGIEWAMDAPVLKPISEALRKPGMKEAARTLIPGYAGVEAATGLVAGAGAAVGTMWDQGVEGFDADIVKEGAGEGIHTALEMVAPIDVAAIGLTGGAGIAAKLARTARAAKGARVLGRLGQAADVSEGLFGGGQFLGGLEEGNLAEMGIGLARAAGGVAGAAWIPDVPSPKQLGVDVVEEFLPERVVEPPSDIPDLPGGETMARGPFDVPESWGPETGAVEFGGKRPPEPVKLDPLPEDPNALIDLWGGGEGSSHFSRSAERAGSYPGTPRHVQITRAQFDEFHAEAANQGLPATDDVFLPNDIVKQSVEDPSAQPRVWEGEGGEDVQAILKEMEVEEFLPPARTGSEQVTEGGLEGSYQEGVVPVQKGVQGVQEGVQEPSIAGRAGEASPLEPDDVFTADEAARFKGEDINAVKAFDAYKRGEVDHNKFAVDFPELLETYSSYELESLIKSRPGIADWVDKHPLLDRGAAPRLGDDVIDVEAKRIEDVEPYDQVPDDIARVEADADAAILEADAAAPKVEEPIKPPAKPALEAVVPTAKGQSFNEFMQEKFGDKRTTSKERAIARAEYKAIGEAKKLRKMAEDAGIPPERLQAELDKGPPEPEAQNIRVDEWLKNPVRSNFEKIHPGLAAKFDDYFGLAEGPSMRNIAETYNIKWGLSKSQRKEVIGTLVELDRHPERNLDDLRFDNPQVEAAVRQVRTMLDQTWDDAVKGGVRKADDRPRKNYFPRKFAEGWEDEALQSPKLTENWESIDPHLEKPRLTGRADYRRDWDVLDEYFIGSYRRIAEVQTFGKGLKELKDLFKTLPLDPMTAKFVRTNARRVLGREPEGLMGKVLGTARHTEALADLGLAPFYQPIQYVNVGLHAGFGRSVRGLTNFMTHYGDETYRALRSGALTPNISQEVIGAYGGKSTFYPRAVENFMYGIPTTDKFTRIPANTAGRLLVQDALESKWYQTRYAKWSAGKDLKGLGFDVSKIKDTPEWHDKVGKALSDKALYRTGAMESPGWFSSPAGKLGSQYTRFMYRHSIMIGNLFKEAAQGNVLPLTRFLTVSMPIIQGASEVLIPLREGLREAIKQSFSEDPYDIDKIKWEALGDENAWDDEVTWGAILRNKRIPMSHPLKRALQNFTMYGGIGLYQMMIERIFRGGSIEEKGAQWLGPVIGTGMEAVGSIAADIERATEGELPRHTPRVGLQQIPVGGYQAANRLFPPEEQGRGTRGERRRRTR